MLIYKKYHREFVKLSSLQLNWAGKNCALAKATTKFGQMVSELFLLMVQMELKSREVH